MTRDDAGIIALALAFDALVPRAADQRTCNHVVLQ